MSRTWLIEYYLEQSLKPDFQIDQIRKELEPRNVPDEDIRIIVSIIDNEIQRKALLKTANSKGNELVIAGSVLALAGACITIGTFTGLINMGDSFLVVYGPFFGGLSLLFTGLAMKRK